MKRNSALCCCDAAKHFCSVSSQALTPPPPRFPLHPIKRAPRGAQAGARFRRLCSTPVSAALRAHGHAGGGAGTHGEVACKRLGGSAEHVCLDHVRNRETKRPRTGGLKLYNRFLFTTIYLRLVDDMATANDRLAAVDPRRRVNRDLYPKDSDMPEFPAAVLLNHVGLRAAQASVCRASQPRRPAGRPFITHAMRPPIHYACNAILNAGRCVRGRICPQPGAVVAIWLQDAALVAPRAQVCGKVLPHPAWWPLATVRCCTAAARVRMSPLLRHLMQCPTSNPLVCPHRRSHPRGLPVVCGRLFALGYVAGPAGVVTMAIADKKGPTGQPISEEGVDDRAFRKSFASSSFHGCMQQLRVVALAGQAL